MKFSRISKILIFIAIVSILCGFGFLWLSDHYVVPIMMYHNVEYLDHHEANWVNPKNFEYHMSFLRKHNYNIISLKALVDGIKSGKKFPFKTVVVTFDDGKDNVYLNAYDILKKYEIPTILFIPSDDIGTEDFMTYPQLSEMLTSGIITIGNHTRTQAYLPSINKEEQEKEIIEAKRKLEKKLGIKVYYFAYPIGGFSDQIKQIIKESGHKAACTTNRGFDRFNKDVYELNRIRFSNKDNRDSILFVKLSGFYNLFRKSKNPY